MRRFASSDTIELRLDDIHQLFETKDPYPFRQRDLAKDADVYICEQAAALPKDSQLAILIHLPADCAGADAVISVGEAVPGYFAHRARITKAELTELFRIGRRTLTIGLAVLGFCLLAGQVLAGMNPVSRGGHFIEEGFIIVGWVALWRPLEIFLYDWWPISEQAKLYRRLASASVEVSYEGKP